MHGCIRKPSVMQFDYHVWTDYVPILLFYHFSGKYRAITLLFNSQTEVCWPRNRSEQRLLIHRIYEGVPTPQNVKQRLGLPNVS